VGASRQRRPPEGEPFEVAAELLVGVADTYVKRLDQSFADPAVQLEVFVSAWCR
jgi:hypothetical protein